MSRLTRGLGLLPRLVPDLLQSARPPILVLGMARSGTTWVASVLNQVRSVRCVHEPFNATNVPGAVETSYRWVPPDGTAPDFGRALDGALRGDTQGPYVLASATWPYRRLRWWPGRSVLKDVDVNLAAGWILRHRRVRMVVVIRHPCAVAASWVRLSFDADRPWRSIAGQEDFLATLPAEAARAFLGASGRFERLGAVWGAVYRHLLSAAAAHPGAIVVRHEDLCRSPAAGYRSLFGDLGLPWSRRIASFLAETGSEDGGRPYEPRRVTGDEPGKWRTELGPRESAGILRIARRFGVEFPLERDGARDDG